MGDSTKTSKNTIIRNVRCSFPNLWEPQVKTENGVTTTYPCGLTLILDPTEHAQIIAQLRKEIAAVKASNKVIAKAVETNPSLCCLRKADRDEYGEDALVLKANAGKDRSVIVLDKYSKPVADKSKDPIYSGCRVNAKVEIWGQENKWGKRINCKVLAVQFAGDDASFDGSYVSVDQAIEGFEALENADDDLMG